MSDGFNTHRDECSCGHAKESHYEKKYGCLASRCDCSKYVNAHKTSGAVSSPDKTSAAEAPHPQHPAAGWHNDVDYYYEFYIDDSYGPPPPSY